jgi:hypothetical protein
LVVDPKQQQIRLMLVTVGGVAAGLILATSIAAAQHFQVGDMGAGQDARAYWLAIRSTPYQAGAGTYGAYLYSPAFTQIFGPLLSLGWQQFLGLWTAMLMGALLVLAGPVLFGLMLPLAFFELWGGNIHLLLALSIVLGFRYPVTWSFVLLTKVTPGIGLLWFAVRREWRNLAISVLATLAVVGASIVIDARLWNSWLDLLTRETGSSTPPGSIGIPLGLRLPFAALIVVYAAASDKRWLVPFGALLAMPVLWWGSLSLLIAVVALERERLEALVIRVLSDLTAVGRAPRRPAPWAVEPEG